MRPSSILKRFFSTKNRIKPKICVVGAGPAGFYAAQHLLKKLDGPEIDIYEKLPVPFGLVRFGVAPDHPEVKNVINTFTKTAQNPHVRFLGNVNLGTDVSLRDLRENYHIVLLTYGAEENRHLNIPGEQTLSNVIPARKIVGWYNGLPWDSDLKIDLSGESAAIFGQGNVAIDVARILLKPVDELKKTDITQFALEALAHSKIKTVYLIGRRGPLQAAFTIKELREMLKLQNCNTIWQPSNFDGVADCLGELQRPKKRLIELMLNSVKSGKSLDSKNMFKPVFFRSPLEFIGQNSVEKITLGVNKMIGDDLLNKKAVLTDSQEILHTDLAITSIGYKSIQVDPSIEFDDVKGVVKNQNGKIEKGFYVCGWLGTGPMGVILTTMSNAFGVADDILKDIELEKLVSENKGGFEEVKRTLIKKNVQVVEWDGWERIDKFEVKEGEKLGKPREKVVDLNKMLEIAS